jgi:energy-converting hydrogenase A subunit R
MELKSIAKNHLGIIPGAIKTIETLKKDWDVYIISTSYTQFAYQVAKELGVPIDHVYCTNLDVDSFKDNIKGLKERINVLLDAIFPKYLESGKDFGKIVDDLNEFFWANKSSSYNQIMKQVVVRGGKQKELAIEDISDRTDCEVREIIATGDSITDINMLGRIIKENGIAISFNGNNYSLPAANIAVTTSNVMGILPVFFNQYQIWEFITFWEENFEEYKKDLNKIDEKYVPKFLKQYFMENNFLPRINDLRNLSDKQKEDLIEIQKEMRKKVRGWVGGLG